MAASLKNPEIGLAREEDGEGEKGLKGEEGEEGDGWIDPIELAEGVGQESHKMSEVERKGKIKVRHGKLSGMALAIHDVKPLRDAPVAELKRGLTRVLFNPSVHFLRDPRSHVYNFNPSLERIPQAEEFAFHRMPQYVTASEDEDLLTLAKKHEARFYGSTSTLTGALGQIYQYISGSRPVSLDRFTSPFKSERNGFTTAAKLPAMIWLKYKGDGRYAIDNDKRWDPEVGNILSDLGRVMEKMLTSDEKELKRFMTSSPESGVSEKERNAREAYRYCKGTTLLMRSQLDCHDARLPGTGTFDIKTRAALTIRHDRANYAENRAYDIHQLTGLNESFEKELYDMARSAFLKYSMQVRIGGMDGIFVAYHNTARIFGFQYISLSDMDEILHGSKEMGLQAFRLSVTLFENVLKEVTELFPEQNLSLTIDASHDPGLAVYVHPEPPAGKTDEDVPVVKFTVLGRNTLNGFEVSGVVDFASVNQNTSKVDWVIEYEITKTPMTEEGFIIARNGLKSARKKHAALAALNLPTGKKPADMVPRAADAKTTASGPEANIGKSKDDKEIEIKWKAADGHILRLRRMARESGKRYKERMAGVSDNKPVIWKP